ncbi:RNA polymerase sigma factor [Melioribacteraceae bacterium 4301-Me]|uniref:RNA polymerase sigma factor n=1 Tax=Pyranulibacter aquaticus TaxID=3163344 RepID=UPI00359B221A
MSKFKELSDLELMQEIANFESRALEELYERYSPILYTIIKKISPDEPTARRLLIEVFVMVWRKIKKFDFASGNVYTWLITIARNKAVDQLRRSRATSNSLDFYDDEYEDFYIIPTLARDIDALDLETVLTLKPKIERALSKLTDTQKYVLHLAYYEGFTIDEIADKLKVPIETVRSKVLTALQNLKDYLMES